MRAIPVDVQKFAGWMCANVPEPKLVNGATGEVKKDRDGQTLYTVTVVAMRGKDSSVIQVTVAGEPRGLGVGTPLRLIDLEAVPWEVEGRNGVSYRAASVVPMDVQASENGAARRGAPPSAAAAARGGEAA